jgi:hypothetical protein
MAYLKASTTGKVANIHPASAGEIYLSAGIYLHTFWFVRHKSRISTMFYGMIETAIRTNVFTIE